METEMKSLNENNVWDVVELPPERKPVGSKWVFKGRPEQMVQSKDIKQGLARFR